MKIFLITSLLQSKCQIKKMFETMYDSVLSAVEGFAMDENHKSI